jgi:hypothetical protein
LAVTPLNFAPKSKLSENGKLFLKDLIGAPGAGRGWRRAFDDPIPLPRGRQLVTLQEAGTYITKLPKAEHEAEEWQAAMEALMLVATSGGPTMLARVGVMRALNRNVARVFNPDRKDHHWGPRDLIKGARCRDMMRELFYWMPNWLSRDVARHARLSERKPAPATKP